MNRLNRLQALAGAAAIFGLFCITGPGDYAAELEDTARENTSARKAMVQRAQEMACGSTSEVITTARGARCVETAADGTLVAVSPVHAR